MVQLLFTRNKGPVSRFLRWITWSEYSHVDFVLKDGSTLSSEAGKGVCYGNAVDRLDKSSGYQFLYVDADYSLVLQALKKHLGAKYDYAAIFGHFIRRDTDDPEKWFCSELIAHALEEAGRPVINKPTHRITPQDLLESPLLKRHPNS